MELRFKSEMNQRGINHAVLMQALLYILLFCRFVNSNSLPSSMMKRLSNFEPVKRYLGPFEYFQNQFKSIPKNNASHSSNSLGSHSCSVEIGTRVVTDIDDTVKSSGGVKLFGCPIGGIDVQYDRGILYPGAIRFAFELSHTSYRNIIQKSHKNSSDARIRYIPPKVAVLTARAKEFKFALALKHSDKICSAYRSIGEKHGFLNWGVGQVYYGSVKEWILHKRKGIRKFENFKILVDNDLKRNNISHYIFIGDTGEKDEDAGERICQKYGSERMKAIFLHVVSDNHQTVPNSEVTLPPDRTYNNVPIYYFRTYVGAAYKAYKASLLNADGVKSIINSALEELNRLDIGWKGSPKPSAKFSNSRWHDLNRDISEAKVSLTPKQSKF